MRRQKLNKISAWVLGLAILLLSHVPNVSAQIQQSPSDQTVARFLYQTSFGPTPALINEVRENGLEDWIQKQSTCQQPTINHFIKRLFLKAYSQTAKMLGIKLLLLLKISLGSERLMH